MSSLSLPREIIDHIIDIIAEARQNRETLRICSQVARIFVQRAHHHLFSNFQFFWVENGYAEALENLLQVLRNGLQFPGIGIVNHVRHFHLHGPVSDRQLFLTANHTALFKLLYSINGLECLSLWLYISFLSLDEECRASLITLCHSPNLKTLIVRYLFDIPKSLLHGSRIKRIDLSSVSFLSYPPEQPKILYQPESILARDSYFHTLLDAFHAGGGEIERSTRYKEVLAFLKELDLTINNVLDIPSCLDKASFARVLEDIKLTMDIPFPSTLLSPKSNPIFLFHNFLNLRILRLDFHQSSFGELVITPVREFLEFSILPPLLEKLFLSVGMHLQLTVGEGGILSPFELDNVGWKLLDATLTRPPFCTIPLAMLNLRYFVRLMVTPDCKLDGDALFECARESILRDGLPRSTSSRPPWVVVDANVYL